VARVEAYLRAKFHLHLSYPLVTLHQRHRQDRQTGQRSDSVGRTVLSRVAQKRMHFPILSINWFAVRIQWFVRFWRTLSRLPLLYTSSWAIAETARRLKSVEILSAAAQLYEKSHGD